MDIILCIAIMVYEVAPMTTVLYPYNTLIVCFVDLRKTRNCTVPVLYVANCRTWALVAF